MELKNFEVIENAAAKTREAIKGIVEDIGGHCLENPETNMLKTKSLYSFSSQKLKEILTFVFRAGENAGIIKGAAVLMRESEKSELSDLVKELEAGVDEDINHL